MKYLFNVDLLALACEGERGKLFGSDFMEGAKVLN
jgi:hypothetical protein